MHLFSRQNDPHDASGDAAGPTPCRACGAPMDATQDWCLTCGTAAPGRLGGRPGFRAASSVAALTLVLVTAAGAASYAALSGDAGSDAGLTAPANVAPVPGAVAQVPDGAVPAPAPVTPPPTPPPTSTPSTPVPLPTAPKPLTPTPAPAKPTPTPATKTPTTSTPSKTTPSTSTDKPPATVALKIVGFPKSATAEYDPSKRIVTSSDPTNAHDDKRSTAWSVTAKNDGNAMQVGLLIKLGDPKTVKQLDLRTTTPGGRAEIYAAVGSALPPDILDTRWEHVGSRSQLGNSTAAGNKSSDDLEKIRFRRGGGRYRYVVVWLTNPPPKGGPTVKITELRLLG